ncbi:hypothetical protein [Brevundimonas sp.]|uniref:hypothetical protein n=1 Tax=Brevundimonas sp. TaxID=1871086 RepID=UPI0035684592
MRFAALIVASATALVLTACQKAEEKAPEASSEAVEAAGIADDAAVTTTMEQANDDARIAAEAQGQADAAAATKMAESQPEAAAVAPAEKKAY